MDRNQAERLAWAILGEVEEVMSDDGVAVFPGDVRDDVKARAFFEDDEYEALEDVIVGILLESTKVQPVLQAESFDGHDSEA